MPEVAVVLVRFDDAVRVHPCRGVDDVVAEADVDAGGLHHRRVERVDADPVVVEVVVDIIVGQQHADRPSVVVVLLLSQYHARQEQPDDRSR